MAKGVVAVAVAAPGDCRRGSWAVRLKPRTYHCAVRTPVHQIRVEKGIMSVLRKTESTNAMAKTEMNFGNGEDARELQDSELGAVSGGASMVEYAMLMGALVAVTVARRL